MKNHSLSSLHTTLAEINNARDASNLYVCLNNINFVPCQGTLNTSIKYPQNKKKPSLNVIRYAEPFFQALLQLPFKLYSIQKCTIAEKNSYP